MLCMDDFEPKNWESVTWQIVSHTYVRGYMMSECIPPPSYLQWVSEHLNLNEPGMLHVQNARSGSGLRAWKVSIRQVNDVPELGDAEG